MPPTPNRFGWNQPLLTEGRGFKALPLLNLRTMKQPKLAQREEYIVHESAIPSRVRIPGTKRDITLREMHPGTIEFITKIWIERDLASAAVKDGADVLKDLAKEPYFAFKEAAAYYLNHDIKLRLIWPFLWRWWAFRYTESQMVPIIVEGKKKLPLMAHFETMVYSMDMRTDMMKMTTKEADQYRQELLSATKQPSSRISPHTGNLDGESENGSGISATAAS